MLAHLQLDGDQSIQALAKKLKTREHRVHYALHRLVAQGIIRRVPRIELSRLGYTYMHAFFSVRHTQQTSTKKLLQALTEKPGIVFLAELGGEYQYELIAAVLRPAEIAHHFEGKLGDMVTSHTISSSMTYEFYPKNYLSPSRPSSQHVTVHHDGSTESIDAVDQNIIRAMLDPSCDSLRAVARKLSMPFPTVQVRVEKMKKKRILGGSVYDVDPLDYGYCEYILLVYTRGIGSSMEEELFQSARKHPNITHARSLIGEWNFEIGIEVQHAEDVIKVVEGFTEPLSSAVLRTKLLQRFRALHYRPYPF